AGQPGGLIVEITKALAALQPLYGKDNVEIITTDGRRVRGTVRSMKTTQALTTPSVKMEVANGQIVKIPFPTISGHASPPSGLSFVPPPAGSSSGRYKLPQMEPKHLEIFNMTRAPISNSAAFSPPSTRKRMAN